MNGTTVTLVGNVATGVEYRETASGGVARFRFAVTGRRWVREQGAWADGSTSFYTVFAWRTLGANLAASVAVGDPLVVHGRLRVREEEREGKHRTFVDVDAVAAGHDLTRGTAAFRRTTRSGTSAEHQREYQAGHQADHQGEYARGVAPVDASMNVRTQSGIEGSVTPVPPSVERSTAQF
ncbi:single-stranded DNA-binding protein [Streptomyces solicathayae]|uniref:Single-stranded DNA-binding protein n=1 Tax=Streptomyces solicathayae TaxID=3081768 RepID=A0ABZ0LXZ6_9ACTN|nr:single-stranded DNA-binding protein [Streptomyces sp. HUAS YS2]WOX24301.1 single-stranded DNA-binding protein [Streptomyces sp. HUAS YS2]